MKSGIDPQDKTMMNLDGSEFEQIEAQMRSLLSQQNPNYVAAFDILNNINTLRFKSPDGRTLFWLVARIADDHPQLLDWVIQQHKEALTQEDLTVAPALGPFAGKTAKWLIQFSPTEREGPFFHNRTDLLRRFGIESFTSSYEYTSSQVEPVKESLPSKLFSKLISM